MRHRAAFRWEGFACIAALAACSWGRALDSDPSAWSPGAAPEPDAASAPETSPWDASRATDAEPDAEFKPNCTDEPPYDPSVTSSTPARGSHRAGEPCLTGCHEQGGTARLTFAAAGTIYRSQTSRDVAPPGGAVHQIGSTTLTLDGCGNFYAIASALATGPNQTQPFVQNPTLRRMDKILFRQSHPGDCNQSGCHDFSRPVNWGIFY
jgi:hypothetical protein